MKRPLPEIPDGMLLTKKDRPDTTGIALLQARHILNEMENAQVQELNNGSSKQEVLNMNTFHYYAWGLFKTTLLKAMKNRKDLKRWSPDIFHGDEVCGHCNGEGKNPIPQDSPQYREHLADDQETQRRINAGEIERTELDTPFNDGDPLWTHCTPCQGSGILTQLDKALGK